MRVVSPVGFIATKYVAFLDRGAGDYYASHDLEDLVTVIDGREKIVEEVAAADPALCAYVIKAVATLISSEDFMEALPGHLPPMPPVKIAWLACGANWPGLPRRADKGIDIGLNLTR